VTATATSTPTTPTSTASAAGHTWLYAHLATLAVGIPVLLWVNRDQWFAGDEFEVVITNGLGANPARASIFAPHFEHWSTLGVLVYKALYAVFALHTYLPYVLVLVAVVLAVAHLTWRLLLRVGVAPAYATAVAALTMVLAVGWENRSTAWQITIIAPVALGFGALLAMPERGPWCRRDLVVVALLLVGLMCSGVGVTMTVVVAIAALLRRGWRVALATVALPAVVYAVWYALEGTSGQRNTTPMSTALRDMPEFVWRGFEAAYSGLTRIDNSGYLVLAALVVWLVWRARPRQEPWPLVVATAVGAVVSLTLTALRRGGATPATRYTDIVVLLSLPALTLATQEAGRALARRFGRIAVAVCGTLVVAFLVVQVIALDHEVSNEPFVGEMRPRVLATARIMRNHEPIASSNIFGIPYLTQPSTDTIARFDRNGELPALDVSRADVLTAREYVETVVGSGSAYPEGRAQITRTERASTDAGTEPGCVTVTATTPRARPLVALRLAEAGSFRVAAGRPAAASLAFVERAARGRARDLAIGPGEGTAVGISRATDVELTLPRGTTSTLCGLG
jgi:hypothetical protein